MSEDQNSQPPLPFEPALQLVSADQGAEPDREMSLGDFTSRLFDEFVRRSAALGERESQPRA